MKTYTIDIHPNLQDVTFSVANGAKFERSLIRGDWHYFYIDIAKEDLKRVKRFAVEYGNDKSSNGGNWFAHCNGFAMGLCVSCKGKYISINTYRPYGRTKL